MDKIVKIIPCLDIKDGRVVKEVKFVNLRDARDPVEAAVAYCQQGADELVFLDISATVEGRGTKLEWVKKVAEAVAIPVTASGGAGKLEHLYEAVIEGKASAVLAASIFHFGEISIPQAKKYLREKGIAVK